MAEEKDRDEGQAAGPLHIWFQSQRAWCEAWKNMTEMANPLLGQSFAYPDFEKLYAGWMKTCESTVGQMMPKGPEADSLRRTYDVFMGSASSYMSLQRTWMQMMENWKKAGTGGLGPDALKNWGESVKGIVRDLMEVPLLGPLKSLIGGGSDLPSILMRMMTNGTAKASDSTLQAILPWFGAMEGLGKTAGSIMGNETDPATYQRFNEVWMKAYQDTMGRFLGMPMVGPTRQSIEKMMKTADSFIKFSGATIDFMFRMYEPAVDAFQRLSDKAKDLMQKEPSPETFREFYNLLLKVYEMRFYELFKSESFTSGLHLMLNAALEFRRSNDALMESMLKDTPIITRTEMDEVLGEVYSLKKALRRLEAEVEGLKGHGGRTE